MSARQRKRLPYYKIVESCLFNYKHFPEQIAELDKDRDLVMPQWSRSLIKFGEGSTRSIFATSETERWAILRAGTSVTKQRDYLASIHKAITAAKSDMPLLESNLVRLRYDLEYEDFETRRELRLSYAQYHRRKRAVITRVWREICKRLAKK